MLELSLFGLFVLRKKQKKDYRHGRATSATCCLSQQIFLCQTYVIDQRFRFFYVKHMSLIRGSALLVQSVPER
jgi:hypothetical protein